ncbi:MAG TPA: VCBS repeat-containing protein, partial [Candidatus Sulfotelmatobacter sp.]|nr:VCBS repeat-containing protein [Candidatus Sulfotelmatobacter sp.]
YDNDGWLDIYMVNGSTFDAETGKTTPPHAALFHNNHDGRFTDVAEAAGVTNDRWGFPLWQRQLFNSGQCGNRGERVHSSFRFSEGHLLRRMPSRGFYAVARVTAPNAFRTPFYRTSVNILARTKGIESTRHCRKFL